MSWLDSRGVQTYTCSQYITDKYISRFFDVVISLILTISNILISSLVIKVVKSMRFSTVSKESSIIMHYIYFL
jgi:hypothetical protein